MITESDNQHLTTVAAGTPSGELLRRYWYPIATTGEMRDRWTKRVRLLGEDLVLYRDRSGRFGLIGETCPHRRASLSYGIPESDGIRCPYHGWKFDGTGACIDQPNEPEGSTFKDKVSIGGYAVGELGGLIWGYLGPQPAPLIPKLDGFVVEPAIRQVGYTLVKCNWLQIMENSVRSGAHGVAARAPARVRRGSAGRDQTEFRDLAPSRQDRVRRVRIRSLQAPPLRGSVGRCRRLEGRPSGLLSQHCSPWVRAATARAPIRSRSACRSTTRRRCTTGTLPSPWKASRFHAHLLEDVALYEVPCVKDDGEFRVEMLDAQDVMAWVTQGPLAKRELEKLGTTDRGVIMFRRMLEREIERVAAGSDPMGVIRGPQNDKIIDLHTEYDKGMLSDGIANRMSRTQARYSPYFDDLVELLTAAQTRARAQRPLATAH